VTRNTRRGSSHGGAAARPTKITEITRKTSSRSGRNWREVAVTLAAVAGTGARDETSGLSGERGSHVELPALWLAFLSAFGFARCNFGFGFEGGVNAAAGGGGGGT